MKTIVKMAVLAVVLLAAMSCKQAPKYALTDGEWVMVSWTVDEGDEAMVTRNRPTMAFTADAKLSGSAGCNRFSGNYEVDGDKIRIDMGALTRMMCLDMTVENAMVSRMPDVTTFAIEGNQLILYNTGKMELFRFDNKVEEVNAVQ